MTGSKRFYQKTWFIILALLLFAPVGIGLLWWQKGTWKLVPKLIASSLALLIFIGAVSSPSSSADTSESANKLLNSTVAATIASTIIPSTSTTTTSTIAETTTPSSSSSPTTTTTSSTIASTEVPTAPSPTMTVHFLDVGQGSATLLQIGDKMMIVDGGDREKSSFVVSYLKKLGITKIDVMIATHYDSDHINGLVGVLNVFPVKQVYDANYATDTRVFNSFKTYIQDHNIPEAVPGMKQQIQVGDATVTFIAPRQYGHSEGNDDSICIKVDFGDTSFVIMGDPSADAEQQILTQDLSADVFYASHHGSNGSKSKTLLANVSPEFVVISCGVDNPYGHPGDNTLSRIKATGAQLYRTDIQSTIVATSDGESITWNQKPCNDFTPGTVTESTTAATTTLATTIITTTIPAATGSSAQAYVLNTNTKKFHFPSCYSASTIKTENRQDVVMTREEVIAMGYDPCGNCDP